MEGKNGKQKENFTVRFSDDLLKWVKEEAESEGRSVNNLVNRIVELYRQSKREMGQC